MSAILLFLIKSVRDWFPKIALTHSHLSVTRAYAKVKIWRNKQVHGSDFKVNKANLSVCKDNLCYMELSLTKKQDESDREIIRDESFIQNSS